MAIKKHLPRAALLAAGAFLLITAQAGAEETVYRFDPVTQSSRALEQKNTSAGSKLFQANCRKCHATGKGAKFLDGDARTMQGWNRVFYRKNVPCARDGSWAGLSVEELQLINDYLYSQAYDSWDPRC